MSNEKLLDISWGTIVKLSVAALVIYVVFLVKDILVWVLFGLVISILFDPVIDFLQHRRVPRVLAAVGVYSSVFGIFAFSLYGTAPFFVNEIQRFSQLIPHYFETISPAFRGLGIAAFQDLQSFINVISGGVESVGSNIFNALFVIFGGIFSTVFVISIAIFLSIEEKSVEKAITLLFPKKYEVFALSLWEKSQHKVSAWFLSRLVSSVFVGVATYISLLIFTVPYPFSLGLFSAVLNFVPIVGPLIAGLLIAVTVAVDSLVRALFVLFAFVLIQQIEGNILMPIMTKKLIGLPPALVLISLAIGGQLWGIMGAILAIPLAGILFEFLRDFLKKRKEEEKTVVV
jgi:predicted PurR-regulated permease PerM